MVTERCVMRSSTIRSQSCLRSEPLGILNFVVFGFPLRGANYNMRGIVINWVPADYVAAGPSLPHSNLRNPESHWRKAVIEPFDCRLTRYVGRNLVAWMSESPRLDCLSPVWPGFNPLLGDCTPQDNIIPNSRVVVSRHGAGGPVSTSDEPRQHSRYLGTVGRSQDTSLHRVISLQILVQHF